MSKIKKFLKVIRVEEYFLFLSALIVFGAFMFFSTVNFSWYDSLWTGFRNLLAGIHYFSIIIVFVYFYILLQVYLYLIKLFRPAIDSKPGFFVKTFLERLKYFFSKENISYLKRKIKKIGFRIFFVVRPFIFISVFLTFINLLLGQIAFVTRDRLVNDLLMSWDEAILGFYPFLIQQKSGISFMAPVVVYSFLFLGLVMGVSWLVFYFSGNNVLFKKYIIAMSLAPLLSLPFWFLFPANSPHNAYLINVYDNPIPSSIEESLKDYRHNEGLNEFYDKVGVDEGDTAPVSTFPSMHVAWSVILTYYLARWRKHSLWLTLPWCFLSCLGTVFLIQHYFVDIPAAIPIILMSLILARLIVGLEKKYYRKTEMDYKEEEFKHEFRDNLKKAWLFIRRVFPQKLLDR